MEIRCTCPYCSKGFTIEIDAPERPKTRREVPEEVRRERSERMKAMRAAGIGGRPKGIKETRHRSSFGVARKPRTEGADG